MPRHTQANLQTRLRRIEEALVQPVQPESPLLQRSREHLERIAQTERGKAILARISAALQKNPHNPILAMLQDPQARLAACEWAELIGEEMFPASMDE